MRIVFYVRPWSAALFMGIEDAWRGSGRTIDVTYIANHLEAVEALRSNGRQATFLPDAVGRLRVEDAAAAAGEIENRHPDLVPFLRHLMAERMFRGRGRAWQLDQLARYALFFDHLYASEQPDAIVGEAADIMPNWLAFDMARSRGCEPIGLMPSTLPAGRLLMMRSHTEVAGARERYLRMCASGLDGVELAAARELQATVLEGTQLDYLPPERRTADLARRVLGGGAVRRQLAFSAAQWRERRAGNWFYERNPIVHWARQPLNRLRARAADRLYLDEAPPDGPYAFFPLNFEPEAVLLVHASYFENQLEVVRNVARSLPAGWKLVVKEHFWMRGSRSLWFYRRLREIPNVLLAPFSYPTKRLVQEAEVVTVIVSSCGLEAALTGRPVVMFGDYPWDYAPTIHKVGALTDLPEVIRRAAGGALEPDHPDVLAFAASWDALLPAGRYYTNRGYDWLEPGNVERIADAIWGAAAAGADTTVRGRLGAGAGAG